MTNGVCGKATRSGKPCRNPPGCTVDHRAGSGAGAGLSTAGLRHQASLEPDLAPTDGAAGTWVPTAAEDLRVGMRTHVGTITGIRVHERSHPDATDAFEVTHGDSAGRPIAPTAWFLRGEEPEIEVDDGGPGDAERDGGGTFVDVDGHQVFEYGGRLVCVWCLEPPSAGRCTCCANCGEITKYCECGSPTRVH